MLLAHSILGQPGRLAVAATDLASATAVGQLLRWTGLLVLGVATHLAWVLHLLRVDRLACHVGTEAGRLRLRRLSSRCRWHDGSLLVWPACLSLLLLLLRCSLWQLLLLLRHLLRLWWLLQSILPRSGRIARKALSHLSLLILDLFLSPSIELLARKTLLKLLLRHAHLGEVSALRWAVEVD